MKLFHKIFLCFVVIFGVTFQAAGYLLINYACGNAIEQEKKYAFQEFQHNRYILQSILYYDPEWPEKNEHMIPDIAGNFSAPVVIYREDGKILFANTAVQPELPYLDYREDNWIDFQIFQEEGKSYIHVYDCVIQGNTVMYLLTETNISSAADTQKKMMDYFQRIYLSILCVGLPVIFLLTKMLTGSIKKVQKAARRIAEGRYAERIPARRRDEIGELVSDFNRMAEKVEEKIAQLLDAARQKEDFAANFAHEIKTPLTSVIGYADMLYQRALPREQVKNAAEYILNEGMRLETLSLKLMDLFILERQDFLLMGMPVPDIFDNLKQGIEPLCGKRGIVLNMDMEEEILRVDYDLFKTMILNVVDNAMKADSKNIWITGRRGKNSYQIKIRDNGKGVPPKELGRITEAFYMVDKSRSRKLHGAGLGLALVAKIAEIHNAKMKIESDGKTGTEVCFAFRLPKGA